MEFVRRIRKTDLARNTRQVINAVLRGQTTVVETHGRPEVAILDIVDYRIIRAVMRYYAQRPQIDVEAGLPDQVVAAIHDPQDRLNLVLAHYLAGAISLGRAAELLDLPWLDLHTRFLRLDVPLRPSLVDLEEARADVKAAETWISTQQPWSDPLPGSIRDSELGRESADAFEALRERILPVLLPYGVQQIALFGSVVRGEDTPESDVDILVQFRDPPEKPLGLLTWVRLERELTRRLGRKVDLVSAKGLNRHIRPYVEAEKVVLYEQTG